MNSIRLLSFRPAFLNVLIVFSLKDIGQEFKKFWEIFPDIWTLMILNKTFFQSVDCFSPYAQKSFQILSNHLVTEHK